MKIWHQCTSDLSAAATFKENMKRHIEKVIDPEDSVTVHGMPKGAFGSGSAVKAMESPYLEFLCEIFFCEAALTAEREGYDAMTIGCYMDTGLQLARSLVDIPVLSVTETSIMAASTLGKSYGVVTVEPYMAETFVEKAGIYGNPNKLATVVATQPPISVMEMERPELSAVAEEKFLTYCRKAISAGADVLIPGEGMLNEFAYSRGLTCCDGVPILDGYAVLWGYAKMMHKLKVNSHLGVSRKSYRKAEQQQLEEMRAFHRMRDLTEADFS